MQLKRDDIELLNSICEGEISKDDSTDEARSFYTKTLLHTSDWHVKQGKSNEVLFAELTERLDNATAINLSEPANTRKWYIGIAASLLALSFTLYFISQSWNVTTYVADVAEFNELNLPDESRVILNADSKLSIVKSDWNQGTRNVKLTGEAYFEVKKGSRFQVIGKHGKVTVLGTSFTVYDREDGFDVECFSGRVEVTNNVDNSAVILTKGLKTSIDLSATPKLEQPVQFAQKKEKEWLDGTFNFYNEPVTKVFGELERQFGVTVSMQVPGDKYYTGTFDKENIKRALTNICKPLGYKYEFVGNDQILIIN